MFLTFGEVMARIAPPRRLRWAQALPGSVQVTWGGGEANVAASLALFGRPVRSLTALPRHPIADALVTTLRGLGVDTGHILRRDDLAAFVAIDDVGQLAAALRDAIAEEQTFSAITSFGGG